MKIIAVMPIKLENERLPEKRKAFGAEAPDAICAGQSEKTKMLDDLYVFCSDKSIVPLLPDGVSFVARPEYLDLPASNFSQIFDCFMECFDADIYVYAHATAPFVTVETMQQCIDAVHSGAYDSAFCAVKIQDYL